MSLEDPEYCRQPKENKLHCYDCINEKNRTKKREEKQNIEYLTFLNQKKIQFLWGPSWKPLSGD